MSLDTKTINQMWWSGFCRSYIDSVKDGEDSAEFRVETLEAHMPGCIDCQRATTLKTLEGRLAAEMGSDAWTVFNSRGDITELPSFKELSGPCFVMLAKTVAEDMEFLLWMNRVSRRHSTTYKRKTPKWR